MASATTLVKMEVPEKVVQLERVSAEQSPLSLSVGTLVIFVLCACVLMASKQ